jgi:hypothetical protein
MKLLTLVLVGAIALIAGCSGNSPETEARLASYDAFAQEVYDALAWEDVDTLVDLCAQPGDHDREGGVLVHEQYESYGGMTYREHRAQAIRKFLDKLGSAGGTPDMKLVRIGQPIGLLGTEVDFVGNMFLIVELGGQQQAIEIGSTLLTSQDDRVIMPGELFKLKDMQYYQEMASMF